MNCIQTSWLCQQISENKMTTGFLAGLGIMYSVHLWQINKTNKALTEANDKLNKYKAVEDAIVQFEFSSGRVFNELNTALKNFGFEAKEIPSEQKDEPIAFKFARKS
ncbi:MAG: hypothetical protein WC707_05120 [Candidatus Babeliaceae bacterium]|jgi:hypothetical protein